jgi:hypothetical protein
MNSIPPKDKTCTRCSRLLPVESFYKDSHTKDGLQYNCKTCHSAYSRAHHRANKEKRNAHTSVYHQANKEKRNAKNLAYYQENKEEAAAYARSYSKAHPEASVKT